MGASAITVAQRLGLPVTSSFHTNFDQYTRDYRIGWLKPLVTAWLRHVHNRTLRTFVPTHDLLARLEKEGYANLRLLSRGVDTALFNPARRDQLLRDAWGVGTNDLAVIHVGRMAAEKNYPLLFRAFDAMKAVQRRARLVLVGDGPMLATYQKQRPDAVFTGFYTGVNLACAPQRRLRRPGSAPVATGHRRGNRRIRALHGPGVNRPCAPDVPR